MKSHVARSGKHAGQYVPCPAKIHCRISPDYNHANFAGQQEMDAYNNMEAAAPEFSDITLTDALFGNVLPGMETDPSAIDPFIATTRYPREGECQKFMDTLKDVSDVAYGLKNGENLDKEDYDSTLAAAMDMDSKLWGTGGGMSQSKPEDYTVQSGDTVHLDKGWEHRMSSKSFKVSDDEDLAYCPSHDIFSNGSVALSIEHNPNQHLSNAIIVSKKHPNVAANVSFNHGSVTPSDQIEKKAALMDKIGEAASKKYGPYCSVYLEDSWFTINYEDSYGNEQESGSMDEMEDILPEVADTFREFDNMNL